MPVYALQRTSDTSITYKNIVACRFSCEQVLRHTWNEKKTIYTTIGFQEDVWNLDKFDL